MGFKNFKLISKKNLTQDVFELVFEVLDDFEIIAGQFITFLLPKTGFGRAYSVLNKDGKNIYFIIKRLENGRGGSREICDIEIGSILRGVGPAGHFINSKKEVSKLYIGTGTGIVPLYFMIKNLLENGFKKDLKIIIGNRVFNDLYYIDELNDLKDKYSNFHFEFFLSREEKFGFNNGYVLDFLS
ncbi:MAG: FAD-dependent oxidoreductase, partial [Candidatus Gracilibacteria bacterium]|nr:FAD-dependent oxidoreductase [Candidatus Gracilibacteria bacterium]